MKKQLAHILLFLVGLFGTAAGLRQLDPLPFYSWTRNKVWHYLQHQADYDTVILGSSRVHGGVLPAAFDARMAELGQPTHSFNLAFSGSRPHDFDVLVDWLIEHRPPALRRLVVELMNWDLAVRGEWFTDMEIEMRVPGQFFARTESILRGHHDIWQKSQQIYHHALHTLCNTLCIGQLTRMILDWQAIGLQGHVAGTFPVQEAGFQNSKEAPSPQIQQQRDEWLTHSAELTAQLPRKAKNQWQDWQDGGFNLRAARRQHARLREAGIEAVYVVMPCFTLDFFGRDGAMEFAQEAKVLVLDHPEDQPDLYEPTLWFDACHLKRAGATKFSRWLAETLVDPPPPPQRRPPKPVPPRHEPRPPAPAPEPAVPPPLLAAPQPTSLAATAGWTADREPVLELRAPEAPVGDLLVLVSAAAGDLEIAGVRLLVALPCLHWTIVPHAGEAGAVVRIAAATVPTEVPLFVQMGVLRAGGVVAITDLLEVPGRR